jgi:hypothetical protein
MAPEVPEDQKLVAGLLDAFQAYSMFEGENGAVASEAYQHLTSHELLPALRRWYQGAGNELNTVALAMRDRLSLAHGEDWTEPVMK